MMIRTVTSAAMFLMMVGTVMTLSGESLGRVKVSSDFPPPTMTECLRVDDEESERLKALFEKLKVEPMLQPSNQPRDLPELYRKDPENEGDFIRRDDHLLIDFDHDVDRATNNELIWIIFLPNENRFYIEHRLQRNDPRNDQLFGPYEGNPYDLLPELEEALRKGLRAKDSNAQVRMRRMVRQNNLDLTSRVANLIDFGLKLDLEVSEKNRLVQSLGQILDSNEAAFANESLATQVASIKERIHRFEQEMEALKLEFPHSEYIVAEKSNQFVMPEEIEDALWGEPVDGMRFAVVPESTTLEFEEIVKVTLVVENVGEDEIKFCVHDLVQDVQPDVTFEGKRVFTQSTWFSGWPPTKRYLLKPGDRIALAQSSLAAFQSSRPDTAAEGFGVTSIPVKALQFKKSMRVSYTLRIGWGEAWMRCEDGVMRIYSPAKGEWKGALTAGGFDIEFRR